MQEPSPLMSLCTVLAAVQQEIVLHDINGKEMKATLRKALSVDATRARYPGFRPKTDSCVPEGEANRVTHRYRMEEPAQSVRNQGDRTSSGQGSYG